MKINALVALLLLIAVASGAGVQPATAAAEQPAAAVTQGAVVDAQNWFGNQLDKQAKIFYNALVEMRRNGSLRSGTGSIDLIRGTFSGDQLAVSDVRAHLNGSRPLTAAFQAGRDAFMNDYPDVFYVDFSKLTLRATQSGRYCTAVLGKGSGDSDYLAEGMLSPGRVGVAITELDAEIDRIAASARKETDVSAQLKAVHDALAARAAYTTRSQQGVNVFGAYGALVKGTAVCEGYSRAYKAVLDALGIPCVLVRGTAGGTAHMWCSVQVDGGWYAVDVTWDDPIGGSVRYAYFLKGANRFSVSHQATGVLSPNGSSFTYPALCDADYPYSV
ncbi:transglutaminase domain-containing protein [Anaeromassilibacillus senegalensis]|uniref:transglutaminase domain-containing protein n=1 Tax=Anaeromassilibacillus senegalensis TaxID=1673717 RepID=UPI0018A86B87|nr:transglutaminase domain-containing protein [Anaeromassilibacillus senegalensis]